MVLAISRALAARDGCTFSAGSPDTPFNLLLKTFRCCYLGQSFHVPPTADLVGGQRTGVTVFLGDAFELSLSVDGQLSQGEERLHICEYPLENMVACGDL